MSLKEWLDDVIDTMVEIHRLGKEHLADVKTEDFNICICHSPIFEKEIHIHVGIEQLAQELHKNLGKEPFPMHNDPDDAYKYFFHYRGFEVFQLGKTQRKGVKNDGHIRMQDGSQDSGKDCGRNV